MSAGILMDNMDVIDRKDFHRHTRTEPKVSFTLSGLKEIRLDFLVQGNDRITTEGGCATKKVQK